MRLKELDTTDRAVSPVVGVALLIAIAVILAAVIGAVVLGIGVGGAEAPQASLSFDYDDGEDALDISHDGGDALSANEIVLRGDGIDDEYQLDEVYDDDSLSAGETVTVDEVIEDSSDITFTEDEDVSIVWQDPNGNDESVVGSTTIG